MDSLTLDTAVAASISGLLLHVIYNHYEPRIHAFFSNLIGSVGFWAVFVCYISSSYAKAAVQALLFLAVHLAVLSLSITSYRLFYHPLRAFPGPWTAKLTKWVDFWHTAPGKRHEWLPALHEKYGHIVRIGPNELSFSNPGAVKYLHGAQVCFSFASGGFWSVYFLSYYRCDVEKLLNLREDALRSSH